MKNTILVLMGLMALVSSAHADGYICDLKGQDLAGIGSEISIGLWDGTLSFGGSDSDKSYMDGATGSPDSSYHPRPNHAGATRYVLSGDACDEGNDYAIVDKNMVAKGNGLLTFELDCDTDGGAPSFQVYSCQAQ